jgi:amino acid adenylation domain-containing protein
VWLEGLPLTANGKLDRRALPEPEAVAMAGEYVAPRTPTEELLADIWTDVLGVRRIGVHDNFFELGGHSLLATQLVSRVRALFAVELPLRSVFESPTVAQLAEAIEQALRQEEDVCAPPLVPVGRDRALPLSFAQQRLWFLDQLEPGSAFYNIPLALRLQGALDAAALELALNEVGARHEALRTHFASHDGVPVQVISPAGRLALPFTDLSGLVEPERLEQARRRAHEEAQRPFDLSQCPLLRAELLKLDTDEHVLLLTLHHIVADGWSMGVLVREVTTLYEGYARGAEATLPALPVQYTDYAVWQRDWLRGEALAQELSYWKQQLAGAPALLPLPTDHPRPLVQSYRGTSRTQLLSEDLTRALKDLCRSADVTLFMGLLAAFQTLLGRYTGQSDICVGSPIANRNRAEVEHLIGFFVNTLVLRTQLAEDRSFTELLRDVRETTLNAYAHQDVPFEKLVEELQPERNMSHHPLFQVMFALQNAPVGEATLTQITLAPLGVANRTAKFDLTLSISEEGAGLRCQWEYNTDLFEANTIGRMASHFERLLTAVVNAPAQRLSRLQILADEERQRLLTEWNDTAVEYPREQFVYQMFEQQAELSPDAVAVVCGDEQLVYAALNARANQLARHLQRFGIGPETRVGIMLERTADLLVCLLAVLKAGGAYVPLDPAYPHERLAFMIDDAGLTALLTQQSLVERLPATQQTRTLVVDTIREELAALPFGNLEVRLARQNLAYVMYTSGSTGTPKGVAVTHGSVAAFIQWARERFSREELRGMLASTSVNFDLSVFEMFAPLSCGGAVLLAENALELSAVAARREVTLINVVPSATSELLRTRAVPGSVRIINSGGEAITDMLVEEVYEQLPQVQILNLYGPTEDTVYSMCRVMERGRGVTIGWPIANTQVYILDAEGEPTPVGVAGELYIGGDGLARGYHNRPDLTAARFLPHPFSTGSGARLYRTGDLARYLPDGDIEFLGRRDQQVKLRGFRIELAEVEAALVTHAAVRDVAVIVGTVGAEQQLVAYCVLREGESVSREELRAHVGERLPQYMRPGRYVWLEGLPLTANGKLDRRALPEPDAVSCAAGANYVAARTPIEEGLVEVWSDILRVGQPIGINDNFFELGGHSLLATQLVSRVRELFAVELPLRSVFESPTIAELSQKIDGFVQDGLGLSAPPIVRAGGDKELLLSFAQERLWFINQLEPGSPFYNCPGAVRLTGQLDIKAMKDSLNEIVRRHEALRTVFANPDGHPVQIISPAQPQPLPVIDLSGLPEAEREAEAAKLAREEFRRSFDLAEGQLLRTMLLRLDEEEHVALFTTHHIVSDAWSMGVLVRELAAIYPAFVQGEPSPLAELPIQYADFATWQRAWLQGEVLETQLAYWRRQLADAPPVLELPTDYARPVVQTHRGAASALLLSPQLSEQLRALSRRQRVTLFMTLLAAFKVLLYRYTGQTDICVGSPIANRNRSEMESLIGFFVNTLVMRTDVSNCASFKELLERVRSVALGAYAHQDLPFEKLVQELNPERSLSHTPLFQVVFAFQNMQQDVLELPGVTLNSFAVENDTAKFDLVHTIIETERGLLVHFHYNTSLFQETTIRRMLRHFESLLQSIVAQPEASLDALRFVSAAEREEAVVKFNDTRRQYGPPACLHQLFEAQVERAPHAVALSFEGRHLSYAELDARANRLAHRLLAHGLTAEQPVAICLDRSPSLVVAQLAVLKAGGVCLPLDAAYPHARQRLMLEEAGVRLLLTQPELQAGLAEHGAHMLYLDETGADATAASLFPPPLQVTGDNAAYIIYTSGSMGHPKGVVLTHVGLVNRLRAGQDLYGLEPDERVLHKASSSFDASLWELFWPLTTGARVVLARAGGQQDSDYLVGLIEQEQVTVAHFIPSMLPYFMAAAGERCRSLRRVYCGGETLNAAQAQRFAEQFAQTQLYNQYGPTETTVNASYRRCDVGTRGGSVPIGRPFWNVELYVLDAACEPTAVGVKGELYVGGAGVARGYLNRPDLTAERFIPDWLSGQAGARLYRTGDLARYLPDGDIEFLGRRDQQVKLRGFRIELAEVEAALVTHAAVHDVAVIVGTVGAEQQLVAYCVLREGESVSREELRAHVGERLPQYMRPGRYVWLEGLPLTANGKLDRRALPEPEAVAMAGEYVAPRTLTEELLADIWTDVLGLENIGVEHNFFELGGHSLLATQVTSRLRERFQVELSLRTIFERPTVAGLAAEITRLRAERAGKLETELLAELDELSEEDAETLLEKLSLTAQEEASAWTPKSQGLHEGETSAGG